jgi:CHAT domain-containing protein
VGDPTRDLPFARAELVSVARQVPRAFPRKLLFGDEATVAGVDTAVTGAGLVHFACHAAYDSSRPLESALILAGGARLTLRELMSSRAFRDARLVVASACRTGSTATTLPDEATGLATGLLQAGSAAVVASLWTVSDISSALVMTRFYSLLFPKDGDQAAEPAEALRKAQLWLRSATASELAAWCRGIVDGTRDPQEQRAREADLAALRRAAHALAELPDQTACPFEHPYYWAPYILAGV